MVVEYTDSRYNNVHEKPLWCSGKATRHVNQGL